jgi:hypothetical protein
MFKALVRPFVCTVALLCVFACIYAEQPVFTPGTPVVTV